jgi:PleD family two-component response regulator
MLRLHVAEANPYPSRRKESSPHEWRDLQMSAHSRADQLIKASILLADDHPHFSELEELLLEPEFEVIGKAGNGKALFEEAMRLKPDVIVTD